MFIFNPQIEQKNYTAGLCKMLLLCNHTINNHYGAPGLIIQQTQQWMFVPSNADYSGMYMYMYIKLRNIRLLTSYSCSGASPDNNSSTKVRLILLTKVVFHTKLSVWQLCG